LHFYVAALTADYKDATFLEGDNFSALIVQTLYLVRPSWWSH